MTARWKRSAPPASSGGKPLHLPPTGPLADPTIRRILALSGFDPRPVPPGPDDAVAVWDCDPVPSPDASVLRVHPALPFTTHPDWAEPPAGLIIDPAGSQTNPASGRILSILRDDPLDDAALMQLSKWGNTRLTRLKSQKQNILSTSALPEPGYVLILDQAPGDPAIKQGGASAATFRDMLNAAIDDFPHARIVILLDPLAKGRHHFRDMDFGPRVTYLDAPASTPELLEGASAVYAVSSNLGFDAIMAGHRPKIFGQPFYAGWGLTDDSTPIPRRGRKLSRAQLFAGAMILAPAWYDPCRDRLCTFEEALDGFEARLRPWREDRMGYIALGMDRREYRALNRFFGRFQPLEFAAELDAAQRPKTGRKILVRPQRMIDGATCIEDGFLRPRNRTSPAVSLIADDLGIYHDPSRPSRLEHLIAAPCPPDAEARAERLIRRMVTRRLSLAPAGSPPGALPAGHRILLAGDREDDSSALLAACRAANPDAVLIFLPHPDAARRATRSAARLADHVAQGADPILLIDEANEVWTNTAILGFDALLRGKPVTCLGQPFYAGWGLTRDLAPKVERRTARPTLAHLVHAALIGYPRYMDDISGLPCSVEVIVERLTGKEPQEDRLAKLLSLLRPNGR